MSNKTLSVAMNKKNSNDSASEEEGSDSIVSPEMDSVFKKPFYLEHEEAITLEKNYILHMSTTSFGSETRLALGLSSYEASVYSLDSSLKCTNKLPAESSPVVNVRFAPDNPSLVYVGSSKGAIKLWDLRNTNKPAQQYKDTSNPKTKNLHEKNLCSFDVNSSGRFMCAGTEVTDGDAFLLFWDTRQAALLGGYWECHTDDVTQVSFHPSEKDSLVTGSTDGLINLFDISQSEETESLLQSFNTESSVDKLQWHKGAAMTVSCVTHTADVQLWHLEDSAPYSSFTRSSVAADIQIQSDDGSCLYVSDVHSTCQPDQLMILAGSNNANGRCLRSGLIKSGKLSPHSNFAGNKQIVRCSWFDPQRELLVTGGEAGILSVWKAGTGDSMVNSSQLKATSKLKEKPHKKKIKPY